MNPAGAARQRDAPSLVRLGKYELLSRLGVGGMAELFIARTTAQHGFEKLVALKRILASHADDDQFIQMLLAEARLAATLHHPNIAQVYDVGEVDGTYFFTMEYVFGQDLRKIVRAVQGRGAWLTPELILQIIIGTASGLHYAHEKEGGDGELLGLVHRDVSPSNILVSHDGGVKLVDFGIARISAMQSNTAAGALKGKVPYMSPEQCRGDRLDRRSDIFSLGIMLWELTTRRRLFAGENDIAIAGRICNDDVARPSSIVADYPPELEAIVLKALARDRNARYSTAQELQLDLEEYARDQRMLLSSAKLAGFMSDLFADQIKATKADIRQQIASHTGMFDAANEDSSPGAAASSSSSRKPSVAPVAAPRADNDATWADARHGDPLELNHTDIEMPPPQSKRRLLLGLAGGGAALLLILVMALSRGAPEPTPPVATPATVVTPPAPVPEPVVTPPVVTPGVVTPPVVTPPVADADLILADDPPKPTPGKSTKKRSGKTTGKTTKKPTNWDPDSALPPP
jgi:serine/threonine protein kinase